MRPPGTPSPVDERLRDVGREIARLDPGADDRVHTIADIEIQQSGGIGLAAANGTVDAQLLIANNRNRSILAAGQLTLASNAILNVDTVLGNTNYTSYANNSS